jgi:arylsulfatase A-like enzyme
MVDRTRMTIKNYRDNKIINILIISIWFGAVSGLFEGVLFLIFQKGGRLMGVSTEILWISPIFNILLFGVLGFSLGISAHFFPKLPARLVSIFLFTFLTLLDWLQLISFEKIQRYALIILVIGLSVVLTRRISKVEDRVNAYGYRSLPWILGIVVAILIIVQGASWLNERNELANLPEAAPDAPNVLIVVVDALRADHLSILGYPRKTSPNMDRIAEQGAMFDNAFATASWSLPSHASLVTGRYPHELDVEWATPKALFKNPYPTIAEALRGQGYRTGAFSANYYWFTREQGFGRGFIHFEDYFNSIADMAVRTFYGRAIEEVAMRRIGLTDIPARKRASDIRRSLFRWVDRNTEIPFFAFLNLMDTHDPYLPPQPYRSKFSESSNPGGLLNWRIGRDHPQMTPEQMQGEIDAYDGAISYVDDEIEKILVELSARNMSDNTILMIVSDHGEAFNEHGVYLHANSLYREELHVPIIIWQPEVVPAGVRVTTPVSIAAIPATVMDLAGFGDQTQFPGPSLSQYWLSADPSAGWPYPFAEIKQQPWKHESAPIQSGSLESLISPEWQYIDHENLPAELYDWKNDPNEANNLAGKLDLQNIITQFQTMLKTTVSTN